MILTLRELGHKAKSIYIKSFKLCCISLNNQYLSQIAKLDTAAYHSVTKKISSTLPKHHHNLSFGR